MDDETDAAARDDDLDDCDDLWLDRPARKAMRALADLRIGLDRLERTLVVDARRDLVTWEEIGSDLGVSKQTAHRRHAAHDPIAARRRARAADWEQLMGGPPRS